MNKKLWKLIQSAVWMHFRMPKKIRSNFCSQSHSKQMLNLSNSWISEQIQVNRSKQTNRSEQPFSYSSTGSVECCKRRFEWRYIIHNFIGEYRWSTHISSLIGFINLSKWTFEFPNEAINRWILRNLKFECFRRFSTTRRFGDWILVVNRYHFVKLFQTLSTVVK